MNDFLDNLGAQQYEKMIRKRVLNELTQDNGYYEYGKVNFKNLASLIEDLYSRIEALETQLKDARE